MKPLLIHRAEIINEGRTFTGSVLVEGERIVGVFETDVPAEVVRRSKVVDATGCWLIPGVIDDHVHFRDPGLTHKADLLTESKAAVAGGVTSFMDMPNTQPQTTTLEAWESKMELAAGKSLANYAFYLGATNENLDQLIKADYTKVCGVKVFMGSSTGNMLVGSDASLEALFRTVPALIAVHAESEDIIRANKAKYQEEAGEDPPLKYHPLIRSAEACYASSAKAVEMAAKCGTRLHLLHLTTRRELSLLTPGRASEKSITAEVCIPHLWFDDSDYEHYGNAIKCNPAVKSAKDRAALRAALNQDLLDVVATDHAPHTWEEKQGGCLKAASGTPGIQFSLPLMLDLAQQGVFSPETVVEKMCHAPAEIYRIIERGFIREGYFADLVLVRKQAPWMLEPGGILSKCGWSPYVGNTFTSRVLQTYVNGALVYDHGTFAGRSHAAALRFKALSF